MSGERVERRLAAILAGDIAGYSRLMGADEEGTLRTLKELRASFLHPKVTEHRGRIVKTTGDGVLIEFPSVVEAVRYAVEIQRGMIERNADVPAERRIELRMGINLGDIISDDDDIYGDGVNVAARLEALADPGGICISRVVRTGSIWRWRTWASRASRTLRGRCGSTGWQSDRGRPVHRPPRHPLRRRRCRFPTGRRSRCCRSPI